MSLRILLLAEEAAGMQTLRLLQGTAHRVAAVLTSAPSGPGDRATVHDLATRLGYPVIPLSSIRETGFADTMRRMHVDLLLNVHALLVVPADVVTAPPLGSFNLHPGPLPQYAGLNAPSWAIYHGERSHAVTVHWMDAGIDTGPIAFEASLPIEDDDTGFTLSAKCARAGMPLLRKLLAAAASVPPAVPRRPQAARPRRYFGREVPHDGYLVWTESAARVVNFIRACDYSPFASPWGNARVTLGGVELAILSASRSGLVSDAPPGTIGGRLRAGILVAAQDEWVLVRRVRAGGAALPATELLTTGERFTPTPEHRRISHAAP